MAQKNANHFTLSEMLKELQPSRDPGTNFNIEISSCLKAFGDELKNIEIDIGEMAGENTQINFFEAALLIQNSALVYSKKVEHLHNMVLEALNATGEKRKKNKRQANLPLSLEECYDSLPSDIFRGDGYIEVTSPQVVPLRIPLKDKVSLVPQVPPTLLPRECEQSIYSTLPELKDSNGVEIGKWEDFMLNSFTKEIDVGFTSGPCVLPDLEPCEAFEDVPEVEMLRDASFEREPSVSKQMMDSLTLEAASFQKSGVYSEVGGGFEAPSLSFDCPAPEGNSKGLAEELDSETWKVGVLDPHEEIPILNAPFKQGEFSQKLLKKASSHPLRIAKLCLDFPLPKTSFKRPNCPAFYSIMVKKVKKRRIRLAELKEATTFDELAVSGSAWDEPVLNLDDLEPEYEAYSKAPSLHYADEEGVVEEFRPMESFGSVSEFDQPSMDIDYFHKVRDIEKRVETKLSRNIKAWERQVAPRLEAQKSYQKFSISKYSASIVEWFEDDLEILFSQKAASCKRTDIPRLFLTALHMVESGNVEIVPSNKENQPQNFSMKLLSDNLPVFEDLPAIKSPSFFI